MANEQRPTIDLRRRALYCAHDTRDEAWASLMTFMQETQRTIRAQVVLSKTQAKDILAQVEYSDVTVSVHDLNEAGSVFAIGLSRQWGRVRPHESSGQLLGIESTEPPVYYLLSDFGGEFWRNVVGHSLGKGYPELSRPSLSTEQIRELLAGIAERLHAEPPRFRLTKLGYTSRIADPNARRARASDATWTDLPLDRAFERVEEEGGQVTRVGFEVRDDGVAACRGYVSCKGEVGFVGDAAVLHEQILQPMASWARDIFNKLDGRERTQQHDWVAQPFFIEFETDALADPDARKRLLAVLSSMPNASQSVIHANPYLHVSVLDYLEDTSCEVYVLSSNRISIVPQTRTSPTSLIRLYEHISRQFAQGRVLDYSEVY